MPRAERVLVPGGVEHACNRVVRGEHFSREEGDAGRSLAGIGETKKRADFVVMAYCRTRSTGAPWKQSIEPSLQPVAWHHERIQ